MKIKKRAGVTLLELIIAVTVLMVVAIPVLGMYSASLRSNARSQRITIATIIAQQKIEEFVGLNAEQIAGEFGILDIGSDGFRDDISLKDIDPLPPDKGFTVLIDFDNTDIPDNLIKLTVKVNDTDGSTLCTQENYLNIQPDGI